MVGPGRGDEWLTRSSWSCARRSMKRPSKPVAGAQGVRRPARGRGPGQRDARALRDRSLHPARPRRGRVPRPARGRWRRSTRWRRRPRPQGSPLRGRCCGALGGLSLSRLRVSVRRNRRSRCTRLPAGRRRSRHGSPPTVIPSSPTQSSLGRLVLLPSRTHLARPPRREPRHGRGRRRRKARRDQ
jgi:hypothetical protein